ncbi:Rtg2p [Ascoidea rubescens DSM 1968]|uniref:Ppx-GppA-domain-containing protein n=1 Tax=Ascoidea rubescens DSM 1968 TaxID=1344418 RepID=A0A1D2VJ98_9ASCO|nr:Ppx-GppA-domain-containing protein [Ascoidea rubescens DSM 1968]ODV61557.1 Ppx-GppA-domain-containing protein [Ascoidea rubescens DSM 1968]
MPSPEPSLLPPNEIEALSSLELKSSQPSTKEKTKETGKNEDSNNNDQKTKNISTTNIRSIPDLSSPSYSSHDESQSVNLYNNEPDLVSQDLYAIVDIGSNGIRFSISSIAEHHARIMPCFFKDRLNISLFDAQYNNVSSKLTDKIPIPDEVIEEVCKAMTRFKLICQDFGVNNNNVRVVATEATREASNSVLFRDAIYQATNWKVELLSKEREGRIGAYGVASSFDKVNGLFMDLGGGSTQLSWITSNNGIINTTKKPISLPYGAAALIKRIRTENQRDLFLEIKENYEKAIVELSSDIPDSLIKYAEKNGGFDLFVCGGGFRGFGHLLLSENKDYPIPTIINGYGISYSEFVNLGNYLLVKQTLPNNKDKENLFRVSERRKQQLPAVGLLISSAFDVLPRFNTIYFSQGGVREGALFEKFSPRVRSLDPLIIATRPYAPLLVKQYLKLLLSSLPNEKYIPYDVYYRIAPSLCNLAFVHCNYPKELQSTAALHVATTGVIAGAHGLSHKARGLTGIACCERWGGDLPEIENNYKNSLIKLCIEESSNKVEKFKTIFWTIYIGKIMHIICGIHPGGNIRETAIRFKIKVLNNNNISAPSTGNTSTSNSGNSNIDMIVNDDSMVDLSMSERETERENRVKNQLAAKQFNQEPKFEIIFQIIKNDIRMGLSVKNRIKKEQKRIRKLSKVYNIKIKLDIELLDKFD